MSRILPRLAGLGAVALALSACVGTDVERAAGGAVLGGLGAAALDGNVAGGVIVGAAAGALADDVSNWAR
ncbi:hypothetical protein [Jannaschia rubra]|uniref:Glycine zipper domain-containing protein n=1 Tax=Jannaschia rubra TaxID=282197 RepID=A0A0M6XSJ5_9RHOB|nr:hypothetical protein [Jannaschia rubra]CTQ33014.1 hypothetical protein JAN5088_01789 [Jannaschia rubra]SFG58690.1 hypothetical protein SAMN04488517_10740 [Jannaschia rubra]